MHLTHQSHVLASLLEKQPIPPPRTRSELAREERSTIIEAAKDRWNAELESGVRWIQRTDWEEVRYGIEGAVGRVLGLGLEKGREGIETGERVAGEKLRDFREEAREETRRAATGIVAGAERAVAGTKNAIDVSGQKLKNAKDAVPSYPEVERKAAGTVDAARGSVRDAVSKGIETSKDLAQKAGAVLGIGEVAPSGKYSGSDIERALRERFEGPTQLDKSVQQALEDRYTPIDQRDNTHLRGI